MAVLQSSYLPARPTVVCCVQSIIVRLCWWKMVSISSEIVAEFSMPGLLAGLAVHFTRDRECVRGCWSVQWHGKWWRQISSSVDGVEITIWNIFRNQNANPIEWGGEGGGGVWFEVVLYLKNNILMKYNYLWLLLLLQNFLVEANTHEFIYVLKNWNIFLMYTHKFQYVFLILIFVILWFAFIYLFV